MNLENLQKKMKEIMNQGKKTIDNMQKYVKLETILYPDKVKEEKK